MHSIRVFVALGEPEVNDKDAILRVVITSNEKIIWLDVSVDNSFFMNLFYSFDLIQNVS